MLGSNPRGQSAIPRVIWSHHQEMQTEQGNKSQSRIDQLMASWHCAPLIKTVYWAVTVKQFYASVAICVACLSCAAITGILGVNHGHNQGALHWFNWLYYYVDEHLYCFYSENIRINCMFTWICFSSWQDAYRQTTNVYISLCKCQFYDQLKSETYLQSSNKTLAQGHFFLSQFQALT